MRLVHEKRGAGEPVVLLHGIGHNGRGWHPVTTRLAREYEVFEVDLPGFGRSPALHDAAPTVPRLAETITAFMAAQGHARFHAVGNSLGGGLALELGRTEAALSVCAISPIGFWDAPGRLWLNAVLSGAQPMARGLLPVIDELVRHAPARRWAARVLLGAHSDRVPPEELAEDYRRLAYAPGFAATRRATMDESFGDGRSLRCPVTVAWGDKDLLLLHRTQSRRARAALPQAAHVTLRDCGHIPVYDDPDQVTGVIREALRRSG